MPQMPSDSGFAPWLLSNGASINWRGRSGGSYQSCGRELSGFVSAYPYEYVAARNEESFASFRMIAGMSQAGREAR